jgi:hypothetical protein
VTIETITRLEDVRPGDLFLGPIGGGLGAAIRAAQVIVDGGWRVGPLHVEHIGIVVEASRTLGPAIRERASGHYTELDEKAAAAYEEYGTSPAFDHYPTGVITAPRMVQAMPRGAEEIPLSYDKHWTPKVAYARIPDDYPGQAADAAAIARLMVQHKVAYSFASYGALALWHWGMETPRLTEWIDRRQEPIPFTSAVDSFTGGISLPREAICSVLADQAWSLAGKRVMVGTAPQAVTPSQLGQRLLREMPGVVWGWPTEYPLGAQA